VLLQELNGCTVNIPELKLLRQYHTDAHLWISRFNDVLVNINEREDYHNVDELHSIVTDGGSLSIQGSLLITYATFLFCCFLFWIFMEIIIRVIILVFVLYCSKGVFVLSS
jgi:hypothetical protein